MAAKHLELVAFLPVFGIGAVFMRDGDTFQQDLEKDFHAIASFDTTSGGGGHQSIGDAATAAEADANEARAERERASSAAAPNSGGGSQPVTPMSIWNAVTGAAATPGSAARRSKQEDAAAREHSSSGYQRLDSGGASPRGFKAGGRATMEGCARQLSRATSISFLA
jgi:hypothetical protein